MKISIVILISILIIVGFIFYTCDVDTGLGITPWIEGKIEFSSIKSVDPNQIGDVVVVVAPDFPPKKWTDIVKTPPLFFDRNKDKDVIEYKVPLNVGKYDVIAVLWKPHNQEWSFETISNILGVYTLPNLFKPKDVIITNEDKFVQDVDIYADFGFVRYGAYISGKITYDKEKAPYNPDTDMMILASFPNRPSKVIDYLFAMGWDLALPISGTEENNAYNPGYEFTLNVSPGNHKFLALFWKGKNSGPYDFKRIADIEFPDTGPVIQIGSLKYEGTYIGENDVLSEINNKETGETTPIVLEADFSKTY